MSPEDILKKCAEFNVKLYVKENKLTPAGSLPVEFIKISSEFIPYKQQVIDYIKQNHPELVFKNKDSDHVPTVSGTSNDKIKRLRIPCVNLGPALEKAAGCGCNGAVIHKCSVFEKCRRVGKHEGIAVCTECDKYEPVS